MTLQLIEHKVLSSAAASIEFTNIPQDGTDLLLVVSARTTRSGQPTDNIMIRFNTSSANFTTRRLIGNGSSAFSVNNAEPFLGDASGAGATANTFGNLSVYIPNYTAAVNKSYSVDSVSENNATAVGLVLTAGLWSQTAAITGLTLVSETSSNLVTGSSATLYKVTKGSDGVTSVT